MNLKKVRNLARLVITVVLSPIYFPHFLLCWATKKKDVVLTDIKKNKDQIGLNLNNFFSLLFLLHTNSYFRTLFYFRIGKAISFLISWYRPGNKYFHIENSTKLGKGVALFHPYATIINAEYIGDDFSCLQVTTVGASYKGRPKIGNNVRLAAHVVVVGDVTIGNNVQIGAGSVVVKDIPDNVFAAGNPAKVIHQLDT